MLKACVYCGLVHDTKHICDKKPQRVFDNKRTYIDRFRSLKVWQRKREEIKQRDYYMCQICNRCLYTTISQQYNSNDIEVHHIQKIKDNWDKRLDNDNLISLCVYHHTMADNGEIKARELKAIAKEQEQKHNAL